MGLKWNGQSWTMDEDMREKGDEREILPVNLIESKYKHSMTLSEATNFTILSLNTQSVNNKMQKVRDLTHRVNPAVLFIQEFWGRNPATDYSIQGYHPPGIAVRKGESMNKGGGCGYWVANTIDYQMVNSPFIDKIIETQAIILPSHRLIAINVYCPFADQVKFIELFETFINQISNEYTGYDLICAGDFNIDQSKSSKLSDLLQTATSSAGLLQQVTIPTRVTNNTESIIDLVFTRSNKILQSHVLISDISDHYPTVTNYLGKRAQKSSTKITKRWLNDDHYIELQSKLKAERDLWNIMENMTLNEATNALHYCITNHLDYIAPVTTKTVGKRPINKWLTKGIKISLTHSEKLYKKAKKGTDIDKEKNKKYKKILQAVIRKSKNLHYRNKIKDAGPDSRKLWNIINEVIDRKQCRAKMPSEFISNGCTIKGNRNIANGFNDYFASIGTDMADSIPDKEGFDKYLPNSYLSTAFDLHEVTVEEVFLIMKAQKPKLSCGLDTINNRIVKQCSEELAVPMSIIINKSIREGKVPDKHKEARVIPLYKKGNSNEYGNYRPVSLLPSLSKILEKVICKQLTLHLETSYALSPTQYGFRPKNQTTHVVHNMLNNITENAIKNQCTIATFIDLSKAFDCLQYDKLFRKMESMNFSKRTMDWFKDYLSGRKQYVDIDGTKSDWQTVKLGVPQGSILGPVLFLIYMNDLTRVDSNIKTALFADDTTLMSTGETLQEAAKNMNEILEKISTWFQCNKLNLNPSKTRYMIFNHKTEEIDLIRINNTPIKRVWTKGSETSFKLVGIHIDENLKWINHITAIAKKIASSTYGLHKASKELDCHNKKLLYSGLIHSHLTYGLAIWGHATKGRLNTLLVKQKKAIRKIYNLKYRDHTKPYFVKGNILQLPELIIHTTLCYTQSGLHTDSPGNVKSLWDVKLQSRTDLRDKGIKLNYPRTPKEYINNLAPIQQAKIWNNQEADKFTKELKPNSYKRLSKAVKIADYINNLTPEEKEIIFPSISNI